MTAEHRRIGELARVAGVTVRTLHHYDELGLLTPSERTEGGHRLYTAQDVERLYRLLALRSLGLPLEEIRPLLEGDGVAATVTHHRARVDQQIAALTALRDRLERLLDGGEHSTQRVLDALEAMSMFEKYYTRKAVEDEWQDLYAQVRRHRESGTDPADP